MFIVMKLYLVTLYISWLAKNIVLVSLVIHVNSDIKEARCEDCNIMTRRLYCIYH